MKHYGDITKILGDRVEPVKVIIGGSPCQDLSIAGRRAGLVGERSGLFMEQIRLIKEMRKADEQRGRTGREVRPRFMVWENVPGAFSSNKGADFGAVLQETIRIVEPEAPTVPVPRNGWPVAGCLFGAGGVWSVAWRVLDAQFWGVPQRRRRIALVADFGGECAPEVLFERESVFGDNQKVDKAEKGASDDASRSLTYTRQSIGEYVESTVSATVTVSQREAELNLVVEEPVFCIQGNCVDRADTAKCNGKGWTQDKCFTLNTVDRPAVVYDARGNGCGFVSPTLTGDHESRITDYTALAISSTDCIDAERYCVRRLTPTECERLQGYPDGWTDIGAWMDSKGKQHKESTDGSRYKALGNSIAIPPWTYVLQRLSLCCGEEHSMASLFDGIGGFPLIWERLNGKGSCLWASEIEEFPIAVTRFHFPEE